LYQNIKEKLPPTI